MTAAARVRERQPDPADVKTALVELLSTERFARSDRLSSFLTYVVAETLAERGNAIRAKTIAQDVYGRAPSDKNYNESVVRVDARRLRRLLAEYYVNEGKDAAVQIELPVGTYRPAFTRRYTPEPPETKVPEATRLVFTSARPVAWAGSAILVVVAAMAILWTLSDNRNSPSSTHSAERLALFEHSGAVLQAENLCARGRGMLFPIADMEQQNLATELFKRAIQLAPDYPCGFSGAAHSLATLALFAPESTSRTVTLKDARTMAESAQAKVPSDGWAVSAMAWVSLVEGDLERASELSRLSAELSPADGNVLDFHGVVSILVGDYEEARRATDPERPRNTTGLSHAHRNIYGVANFHLGAYDRAIWAWKDAIEQGEPVSSLTLFYLTVASQARGDTVAAKRYAEDLENGWPHFDPESAMRKLYPDSKVAGKLVELLVRAGWEDPALGTKTDSKG